MTVLDKPIDYLKGLSLEKAKLLKEELNIKTYRDLLYYFPYKYIDKTKYYQIKDLTHNSLEVQIKGKITHLQEVKQKKGSRLVAKFQDETGEIELVWFTVSNWLKQSIKINEPLVVFGKVNWFSGKFSISHPDMEGLAQNENRKEKILPQYSIPEKLIKHKFYQKNFQIWTKAIFDEIKSQIPENLSDLIVRENYLMPRNEALFQIHFPENDAKLKKARERLKFEEIFYFQLGFGLKKVEKQQKYKGHSFERVGTNLNDFYAHYMPFELTNAQKRVLKEIRADLKRPVQMNRLLQGDVGSGKTLVALLSILIALDNGYQACLIAPTEILAQQHFNSFIELLQDLWIPIELLTGSTPQKKRKEIHENLKNGSLKILIGTHALLEDTVQFNNLGLAIIDEQHRFGVAQRAKIWEKNFIPPHILVMTATPIPRTLAMSFYSDLDVSVIDEMPQGRVPIKTFHKTDAHRLEVFHFMKEEISKGRQIYVVYPLIKESETLDFKDLMDGYESIERAFPKPQYQISVVHGQMKPADKEYEMQRFKKGETQIMVATTVIEVGVNVPNASVMVIESAERFGLSQLHQLRGRVGRGNEQSYCILMTKSSISNEAYKRVQTMVETTDGFKISEVDLEMRGPGDLLGTQQSGTINFNITDLNADKQLIYHSKKWVDYVMRTDPELETPEFAILKEEFYSNFKNSILWSKIS